MHPSIRSLLAIAVTASALSSCSPSGAPAAQAGDGGTRNTLSVAFAGAGTGKVRSTDGTVSCSAACTHSIPSGTRVQLVAAAEQGSHFVGWSGACSGPSGCDVGLSSDETVTATFDRDPTPPTPSPPTGSGTLRVSRSGSGKVTSDIRGIDCGQECLAYFSEANPVTLTATPDSGFSFTVWGGACSGSGPCVVAMAGAPVVVSAVFDRLPPLPAECDGLMPTSVPAPIAVILGEDLIDGTSDGTGESFLFTTAPDGVASLPRAYHFVRIRGGAATETASRQVPYLNDATTYSVPRNAESQPEGFDVFRSLSRDLVFDVFASDGTLRRMESVTLPLQAGQTGQLGTYVIAPPGGIATMRWVWDAGGAYVIRYGRFDGDGNVSVADVPVDLDGSFLPAWGVDLAGNVLLVGAKGTGGYGTHPLYGRWLDPLGAPLTEWFSVGDVYIRNPVLLAMPEGLALGDGGYFTRLFRSGEAEADPAPAWLAAHGCQRLTLVRGGRAWVSVPERRLEPLYGPCAEGIEVLTSAGTSCGCLAIPDLLLGGVVRSVGRDGSLIAERWAPATRDWFEVYPGLFRGVEPEAVEDPLRDGGLGDEGEDPEPAAAVGAGRTSTAKTVRKRSAQGTR